MYSYAWILKICYCLHFAIPQCSIAATFTEHLGDKHRIMQLEHADYSKVMPLFWKSLCISLDLFEFKLSTTYSFQSYFIRYSYKCFLRKNTFFLLKLQYTNWIQSKFLWYKTCNIVTIKFYELFFCMENCFSDSA